MGSLGWPEIMVILVIALVIFGPRKLPQLGRTLGKALGEFRRATNDLKNTLELEVHKEEEKHNAPQRKKVEDAYSRRQPPEPDTTPDTKPDTKPDASTATEPPSADVVTDLEPETVEAPEAELPFDEPGTGDAKRQ